MIPISRHSSRYAFCEVARRRPEPCPAERVRLQDGSGGAPARSASWPPSTRCSSWPSGSAVTRVYVVNLVKPGAEPHDLELAPRDVGLISEADVVRLPARLPAGRGRGDHRRGEADQPGRGRVEPLLNGGDPHIWLDPVRFATIGDRLAERLATVDPAHAAEYRRAGRRPARAIWTRWTPSTRTGWSTASGTEIVTSHEAFGYLADRYQLTQIAISGLNPDDEPSATAAGRGQRPARDHGVTTIFFESLVSPKVADTIAREVGARPPSSTRSKASRTRPKATTFRSCAPTWPSCEPPWTADERTCCDVDKAVVNYGGRPVLDGVSLHVASRRGGRHPRRQRLRQVDAGPGRARAGAAGRRRGPALRHAPAAVPGVAPHRLRPAAARRRQRRAGHGRRGRGRGPAGPARACCAEATAEDRRAVDEALAAVGLARHARRPVATLSGGQQQRVLIARALAGRPELLVLDEPTAGVDAASQEAFAKALQRFVEDGGTVLFVAHELGPLQPLITRGRGRPPRLP